MSPGWTIAANPAGPAAIRPAGASATSETSVQPRPSVDRSRAAPNRPSSPVRVPTATNAPAVAATDSRSRPSRNALSTSRQSLPSAECQMRPTGPVEVLPTAT